MCHNRLPAMPCGGCLHEHEHTFAAVLCGMGSQFVGIRAIEPREGGVVCGLAAWLPFACSAGHVLSMQAAL
jgi:hypothetical protein